MIHVNWAMAKLFPIPSHVEIPTQFLELKMDLSVTLELVLDLLLFITAMIVAIRQ